MISDKFVDFYIINEGFYTFTGIQRELRFNISNFPEMAHKIIYIPILNMPATAKTLNLTLQWKNDFFMRDVAAEFLAASALPEDIIMTADCDEIISYEGFKKFDPIHDAFATTEVRYFHFYFNR